MKRLKAIFWLIIVIVVVDFINVKSQSLQLTQYDTAVTGKIGADAIGSWALVKNISKSTVNVKYTIKVLEIPCNESITTCFYGWCFNSFNDEFESTVFATLYPSDELTKSNGLHIKLENTEIGGTTKIWVKFYNTEDTTDFVSFTTTFIVGTNTISDDILSNAVFLSAVPNPVKDNVSISYNLLNHAGNVSIEIYNCLGNFVFSNKLEQVSGIANIDVTALPQGKYYYILKINGEAIKTKNFIVQR